jgi:hypothetical protein
MIRHWHSEPLPNVSQHCCGEMQMLCEERVNEETITYQQIRYIELYHALYYAFFTNHHRCVRNRR